MALALIACAAVPAAASAHLHDDFADSAADVSFTGKEWTETFPANLGSAGKEAGEPNHAGFAGGHSVWTSWQIFDDVTVQARACGAKGADLLIAVYTGNAVNSLTELASDSEENENGCVTADFEAEAEGVYRIAVDAKTSAGTSPVTFRIAQYAANDDFADAAVLTEFPTAEQVDPRLATSEPAEPEGAGSGNSVWYQWTPGKNGLARVFNCDFWAGAHFAVYTGSALNELTPVATGKGGGSQCGDRKEARFQAEEGTTYSIRVEGYAGKGFELRTEFGWTPEISLVVTKSGSGSGTVVSEPAGIECGAICEASFYRGPLVYGEVPIALTATPDPGSVFVGWSGEGWSGLTWSVQGWGEPECGSEPVCEFLMFETSTEVTAEFEEVPSLAASESESVSGSGSTQSTSSSQTSTASSPQASTPPQRKKPRCAKHKQGKKKPAKASKRARACKR